MRTLVTDHELAADLAREAGRRLVQLRSRHQGTAETLRKTADRESQAYLSGQLDQERRDDLVLSEEAADDPERLAAERVWIIDPLDGTREYAEGRDDWAVHVALWERGRLVAGAVALPDRQVVLATPRVAGPLPTPGPLRIAVSRTRAPEIASRVAHALGAELVPMGSAGAKTAAVVFGEVDAYLHAGGQYEWDSAAPVAVARAAGLHASRLDGSALRYNAPDPYLPDLLVCRPELASTLLDAVAHAAGGERPAPPPPARYELSHLDALEAESIHVIREVVAECERPVLLFSGGKDSAVLLHLARKAAQPGRLGYPVLHVDTGHNFPEVIAYRDEITAAANVELRVASVQESIDAGRVAEDRRPGASRNRLQTQSLLDAITEHRFDAALGGARRDEEKARAKERIFSFRDGFGQWDPKNQRPELWDLYNTAHDSGEHLRVFPLSNWTELDVWQYIEREAIALPSIYFAHRRRVIARDDMLYADGPFVEAGPDEAVFEATVRFRTVGDMTCTGAVESSARSVADVIAETASTRITERGATRADDRTSEAAMEDRKREGYF